MFKKMMDWAQGRHTAFAAYFAIVGSVFQWFHHLDSNYIALIAAVQGLVLAHSAKEDYFESKKPVDKVQNQDIPPDGQNS
jgi:hypothetical protein